MIRKTSQGRENCAVVSRMESKAEKDGEYHNELECEHHRSFPRSLFQFRKISPYHEFFSWLFMEARQSL